MLLEHIVEQYPVGVTDFTLPVPTRKFGKTSYKANGKPALLLSEVGFAVYYPAEVGLLAKRYPYLDWVVWYVLVYVGPTFCVLMQSPSPCRPIHNTVKGFFLTLSDLIVSQPGITPSFVLCFFLGFRPQQCPVASFPLQGRKPTT
jgi:hypothetical protein